MTAIFWHFRRRDLFNTFTIERSGLEKTFKSSLFSPFIFQSEHIQIFPITVASTFVTLSWNTSSTLSTSRGYILQVKKHDEKGEEGSNEEDSEDSEDSEEDLNEEQEEEEEGNQEGFVRDEEQEVIQRQKGGKKKGRQQKVSDGFGEKRPNQYWRVPYL